MQLLQQEISVILIHRPFAYVIHKQSAILAYRYFGEQFYYAAIIIYYTDFCFMLARHPVVIHVFHNFLHLSKKWLQRCSIKETIYTADLPCWFWRNISHTKVVTW